MTYKRFARVAILFCALVSIGGLLAFAGWNFAEQGRLEGRLEVLRHSGKPYLIEDLRPRPVPDACNAANVLRPWMKLSRSLEQEISRGEPGVLERMKEPLAAADRAMALPDCLWPIAYEDGVSALLEHSPGMRALADAVLLEARLKQRAGDGAGARASAVKAVRFADLFRQEVTGVAMLDRQATLTAALDILKETWDTSDAAARGQLRTLASAAAADLPRHFRDTTRMCRAMIIPLFTELMVGRKLDYLSAHYASIVYRPLVKRDFAAFLDCMNLALELADTPFPDSGKLKAELDRVDRDECGAIFGWIDVKPYERMYRPNVEAVSWLRMAVTACDLEEARAKSGSYPAELPKSGTATDPITGQPFKYERTAAGYELKSTAKSWKVPADSR